MERVRLLATSGGRGRSCRVGRGQQPGSIGSVRMKTNGAELAVDALTYVSRDLRVLSLNPHPSARENIARLMICLTRGRGCSVGWLASLASRAAGGNTNRRNSFATFHSAASFASPELHTCQSFLGNATTPCASVTSCFFHGALLMDMADIT